MDVPKARRALLGIGFTLVAYVVLVPVWLHLREPYGRAVTAVTTRVALPLMGVPGSVETRMDRSVVTVYTLRYARTEGWGQVQQRLLNVPDLPLALAAAIGLSFLSWRRRALVAATATATIFALHVMLATVTALRLASILNDPNVDPGGLDERLHRSAEQVGAYRDIAPVAVLLLVGLIAYAVARVRPPREGTR